jgi:hypothetical protein
MELGEIDLPCSPGNVLRRIDLKLLGCRRLDVAEKVRHGSSSRAGLEKSRVKPVSCDLSDSPLRFKGPDQSSSGDAGAGIEGEGSLPDCRCDRQPEPETDHRISQNVVPLAATTNRSAILRMMTDLKGELLQEVCN